MQHNEDTNGDPTIEVHHGQQSGAVHQHRGAGDQPFVEPVTQIAASEGTNELEQGNDACDQRGLAGGETTVFGEIEREEGDHAAYDQQCGSMAQRDHPE